MSHAETTPASEKCRTFWRHESAFEEKEKKKKKPSSFVRIACQSWQRGGVSFVIPPESVPTEQDT